LNKLSEEKKIDGVSDALARYYVSVMDNYKHPDSGVIGDVTSETMSPDMELLEPSEPTGRELNVKLEVLPFNKEFDELCFSLRNLGEVADLYDMVFGLKGGRYG